MELNHRLLHVTQVSLPLDHGVNWPVTTVGVEPGTARMLVKSRGSRGTDPKGWSAALPDCVLGRTVKKRVQESHLAVARLMKPR